MSPAIARAFEWVIYDRVTGRRLGKVVKGSTGFEPHSRMSNSDAQFSHSEKVFSTRAAAIQYLVLLWPPPESK